jgi:hypothetical protein
MPGTVPAIPLTKKAVTFVLCQTAKSSRRTTAIFVSNCTLGRCRLGGGFSPSNA